jgi:hypothetical protein
MVIMGNKKRIRNFGPKISWKGRSQWPSGLKQVLSSAARTLKSWVLIPLEAWICAFCVCVCVCVLCCPVCR